jgi:hypothetical protein
MARARSLTQAYEWLRRDQERWRRAESFDDLLRLNVLFLQGKLAVHPGLVPQPEALVEGQSLLEEETTGLVDDLVLLNRLGFFTSFSQPGSYERGKAYVIEQRAAIAGCATPDFANRVLRRVKDRDIVVFREEQSTRVAVTRQSQSQRATGSLKPCTWLGRASLPPEMLDGRIGPEALKEWRRCVPLAAYDRKWRRNTHLWPALVAAAEPRGS